MKHNCSTYSIVGDHLAFRFISLEIDHIEPIISQKRFDTESGMYLVTWGQGLPKMECNKDVAA
ncbi:unnamed protein product [Rhodiola kirilowii]